ncbi:hypothetical protein SD78_1409 [Bacillus badius]|nr:hypothetical protein SD78_1409 [Bacillus badius]
MHKQLNNFNDFHKITKHLFVYVENTNKTLLFAQSEIYLINEMRK